MTWADTSSSNRLQSRDQFLYKETSPVLAPPTHACPATATQASPRWGRSTVWPQATSPGGREAAPLCPEGDMSAGGEPPSSSGSSSGVTGIPDDPQDLTPPAPAAAGEEAREPGALAPRQLPGNDGNRGESGAEPSTPPRQQQQQQQQQADLGGGALDFGFGNSFGSVIPAWPLSPGAVARRVMASSGFHGLHGSGAGHASSGRYEFGGDDASAAVQRHRLDDIIVSDSDVRAAAAAAAADAAAVTAAVEGAAATAAAAAGAAATAGSHTGSVDLPPTAVREQVSLPEDIYGAARVSEWHGVPAALAASTYVYDDIWAGDGGLQARGDIMNITAGWAAGGGYEANQERGGGGDAMLGDEHPGATGYRAGGGGHSAPALAPERSWCSASASGSEGSAAGEGEAENERHELIHKKSHGNGDDHEGGRRRRRRRFGSCERGGDGECGTRANEHGGDGNEGEGGAADGRGNREKMDSGGTADGADTGNGTGGDTSPLHWRHVDRHAAKKRRTPSPNAERTPPPGQPAESAGAWASRIEGVAGPGAAGEVSTGGAAAPEQFTRLAGAMRRPRGVCAREEKFYAGRVLEPVAHPPRRVHGSVDSGLVVGFDPGASAERQPPPLPPPLPPDAGDHPADGGRRSTPPDASDGSRGAGTAQARGAGAMVRSRSAAEIAAALASAAPATATTTGAMAVDGVPHALKEMAAAAAPAPGAPVSSAALATGAVAFGPRPGARDGGASREKGEMFFASHTLEPRPRWGLDVSSRWERQNAERRGGPAEALEGPAFAAASGPAAPRTSQTRVPREERRPESCGAGEEEAAVAATAVAREPEHPTSDMDWQVRPEAMANFFTTVGGSAPRGPLVPTQTPSARLRPATVAAAVEAAAAAAAAAAVAAEGAEEQQQRESPATAAWRRKTLGYSPRSGGSGSASTIEAAVAAAAAAERRDALLEDGEPPQSRSASERTSSGSNVDGWSVDAAVGGGWAGDAAGGEDDDGMDNGSWGW